MKVILIADALTMLVRYNTISSVDSGLTAISFDLIDATMRTDDGGRVTLEAEDRQQIMNSLYEWIEAKVIEHSQGMRGFDAWYADRKMATDKDANVSLEAALILARAAYDAGQLSVAEVKQ